MLTKKKRRRLIRQDLNTVVGALAYAIKAIDLLPEDAPQSRLRCEVDDEEEYYFYDPLLQRARMIKLLQALVPDEGDFEALIDEAHRVFTPVAGAAAGLSRGVTPAS